MCMIYHRVQDVFSQSSALAGTAGALASSELVVIASWEMSPALASSLLLPLAPLATISSAIIAREAAHDASATRSALVPLCTAGAPDLGATMPTAMLLFFGRRSKCQFTKIKLPTPPSLVKLQEGGHGERSGSKRSAAPAAVFAAKGSVVQ